MPVKSYRPGPGPRLVNRLFLWLARRGLGPDTLHVLTTTGRRSAERRTVPVHVIEHNGQHWLVAIYGEHGWVHNLRANPAAHLSRAGNSRPIEAREVDLEQAGDVLQTYVAKIPHVRPYLELSDDASSHDYLELARSHPVFMVAQRSSSPT